MKVLVTGGAGFIGSAVCRLLHAETDWEIVNLDKLTYAASLASVAAIANSPRYRFVRADIADQAAVRAVFATHEPDAVMHLAAESHVDRSISGPAAFVATNVVGTYTLLEAAREYRKRLPASKRESNSCMYPPMRSTAPSAKTSVSPKKAPTTPARPIRRRRRPPIIWPAPGGTPMACQSSSPTVRTTMALTTFLKS